MVRRDAATFDAPSRRETDARDPLSRHRPQGRPVRAPEARRHGSRPPSSTTIRPPRRAPSRTRAFHYLHIVDLNGAFAGEPVNGDAVEAILEAVTIPVQLGGGIRDLATIEEWLDSGIARVILGTVAVRDPDARAPRLRRVSRPHRRRHRRQGRQGGGRRLGGDVRADRRRAGQALRGRRRRRHHLHRHRPRRHLEGPQPRSDGRAGAVDAASRSSPRAASPPSTT